MRRFTPLATSPCNQPLPGPACNRLGSPSKRTPKQRLRPLPSRMPHRRMASDTPATLTTSLRHARCLFHPLREAAARCPHCGGTFCRECVTDEEGKLACPPCLRRIARPPAPKLSLTRPLRQVLAGLTALASLMALFFAMLLWRVNTPEEHLNLGRGAGDRLPERNNE
jgi:hypothetical protein